MATLQKKIAESFLAKLAEAPEFDAEKLKEMKSMLSAEKKPKVDDFVKLFSLPVGGDVK